MTVESKVAWVVVLVVLWITPDRDMESGTEGFRAMLDIASLIWLWHLVRDVAREKTP